MGGRNEDDNLEADFLIDVKEDSLELSCLNSKISAQIQRYYKEAFVRFFSTLNGDTKLDAVELISLDSFRSIISRATKLENTDIYQQFARQVEASKGKEAIVADGISLSYNELANVLTATQEP